MQSGTDGSRARRRLSGKRALFEQLIADEVSSVFGNPGTTEQGFMDLLPEYPSISYYLALHEGVAVGMADGYARATRRPAFVELHIAPGLGNAVGMLYNAMAGHTPMVVYVGQSPTAGLFQEPYLSGDLVSIAKPVTKWAVQVGQAADIPQALRRAFKVANDPPQGPVLFAVPMDLMDVEADVIIEPTSYVRRRTRPPQDAVDEAVDLLLSAKAPAIAVGDNVYLSEAQQQVVALAELLGAPILNAFSNSVNAPAGHALYQPRGIPVDPAPLRRALEPHDLLLAVGTSLFQSILPDSLGPVPDSLRVIHVDYDPWELGKNWPGLLIAADPRETLLALLKALNEQVGDERTDAWQKRRAGIEDSTAVTRAKLFQQHRASWDAVPVSAPRLMAEVAAAIPEHAVVFDEAITSGAALEHYLRPEQPWRRFRARGGGIGGGLPGALGAQVAFPDRPVVGLVSDGASMFNITSLWTAAHHRIPVTYVVCNNSSYRILKMNLRDARSAEEQGRPFPHMDLTEPVLRYDRMADAFGVPSRRVEQPKEIRDAIRWALSVPGPSLVDVVLDGRL